MTFHGKPRASADVMNHVHESPKVMLVPLYVLAVGALFAGLVFHDVFVGHEAGGDHDTWYNHFWRKSLFAGPDNHILEEFHHVPLWVKWSPFVAMLLGFVMAYVFYIRTPGSAEGAGPPASWPLPVPAQQVVLRRALRLPVRDARPSGLAVSFGSAATAG